jgi:hypothetical protein
VYRVRKFPNGWSTWTAPETTQPPANREGGHGADADGNPDRASAHRTAVRFRYDEAPVDLIKDAVYWRDRQWDHDARCWWVDCWSVDELVDALIAEGTVRRVDVDGSPITGAPDPPPSWAEPSWAETVLAAVGRQRQDAVFRVLSKVLNPDAKTGDGELMRELIIRWCSYVPVIEVWARRSWDCGRGVRHTSSPPWQGGQVAVRQCHAPTAGRPTHSARRTYPGPRGFSLT